MDGEAPEPGERLLWAGDVVLDPAGREVTVPLFSPSSSDSSGGDLGDRPSPGDSGDLGGRPLAGDVVDLGDSLFSGHAEDLGDRPEGGLGDRDALVSPGHLGDRPEAGLGDRHGPAADGLGDSPGAGSGAGSEPSVEPSSGDLWPDGSDLPPLEVRPHRLPDNTWGVISPEGLAVGDRVRVVTAAGQSWDTRLTELAGRTARGFAARTEGRPSPG
ncbi:MAG: hypothetical protein OXR67_08055 [Chloroflexota bacterium]|nr:hypothetical protein [Chloroflexota bacterium]